MLAHRFQVPPETRCFRLYMLKNPKNLFIYNRLEGFSAKSLVFGQYSS